MTAMFLGLVTAGLIVWLARLDMKSRTRIDQLPRRATGMPDKPVRQPMMRAGEFLMALPGLRAITPDPVMYRAVGASVIACPAIGVLSTRAALVLAVALVGGTFLRSRAQERRRRRAIERDMPMIIDLVNLSIQSGLTVGAALGYVARAVDSPVSDVFRRGLHLLEQGSRLMDVLSFCEIELGDEALGLTSALQSSERFGSPLGETLEQLVQETRFDLERRAETVARQLSVQLLFPVAGCILPAFALLTAAPLIAGSFGTLAASFH